jgi:formylglycine-generating enzyme required for sulfatase activity
MWQTYKNPIICIHLFVMLGFLDSCSIKTQLPTGNTPQGVTKFTLEVHAINGSITKSPNQAWYDSGTVVMLTAIADNGYHFAGWGGSLTGTGNPANIMMNTNKNAFASFAGDFFPEMTLINGGTFMMGADLSCQAAGGLNTDKNIVHQVTLSSFFIGTYPVTQQLYQTVMGITPSTDQSQSMRPVTYVTWNNAVYFCNALSKQQGMDTVYSYTGITETPGDRIWFIKDIAIDYAKNGFRLPTEAEWEYACKAGSTTNYHFGNDTSVLDGYAWYAGNSGKTTHAVGGKLPNAWGLYDMIGNVWQWCNDWDVAYPVEPQTNPTGPVFGYDKINRGGCYLDEAGSLRSVNRFRYGSDNPYDCGEQVGFRLARSAM